MVDSIKQETERLLADNEVLGFLDPAVSEHLSAMQGEIDRLRAELAERGRCKRCRGNREISRTEYTPAGHPFHVVEDCPVCTTPPSPRPAEGDYYEGLEEGFKAASRPAVPEGWKLVPDQPTHAMLKAGEFREATANHFDRAHKIYSAMLEAAPTPPAEIGSDE